MENSDLYQVIFKRKSIRKFKMDPLPSDTLVGIKEYAEQLKTLFPEIKIKFEYVEMESVKNLIPIKAPHYVLLYSEEKDNYLLNAGFILERLDLFLSASGIGACWLGMAKPAKAFAAKDGLEFVMMLAFGAPSEPLHRQMIPEFKRKSISEMSNCSEGNAMVEAMRLAPSASNSQPWYLQMDTAAELVLYREKLNLLRAKLYGKMNQIDMGIACAFADIILAEQGKTASFQVDLGHNQNKKDGYQYTITCRWHE